MISLPKNQKISQKNYKMMSNSPLILIFLTLFPLLISSQNCISDVHDIGKEGLVWPKPSYVPPWVLYPGSKIYESPCLNAYLADMFRLPLNELTNVTFQQILDTFTENNCPFYIHGGLLRDVLSGDPSHDLDFSYSCEPEAAFQICKGILGDVENQTNVSLCYVNYMGYMFIGRRFIDTGLEGKQWEDAFFHIEKQEYTPNMLYFDLVNSVIVDLSTGVEDIATKTIRIPVRPQLWDLWLFTSNKTIGSESMSVYYKSLILKKVARYWKLKTKGYKDFDNSTKNYLLDKVSQYWDSPNYPMKYTFKVFICEALGGKIVKNYTTCRLSTSYEDIPADKILFCKKYMKELSLDFPVLQEGRIFQEIHNMVAYTKCYDFEETPENNDVVANGFLDSPSKLI